MESFRHKLPSKDRYIQNEIYQNKYPQSNLPSRDISIDVELKPQNAYHSEFTTPKSFSQSKKVARDFELSKNKCVSLHNNHTQGSYKSGTCLFYDEFINSNSCKKNEDKKLVLKGDQVKNYIPFNNTFGKGVHNFKQLKENSNDSLKPSDIILNSIEANEKRGDPTKSLKKPIAKYNDTLRTSESFSSKFSKKEFHWGNTLKNGELGSNKMSLVKSLERKITKNETHQAILQKISPKE